MAELNVSLHIIKNGKTDSVDKLSDKDISIMSGRLSRVMSEYYTQHPKEFSEIGCKN